MNLNKIFRIEIGFLDIQVGYEVALLTSKIFTHPYSLHYDIGTNNIYFSDLLNRSIHRYDLNTNQDHAASIENGAAPSFIIPLRGQFNRFLISDKLTVAVIEWNGSDPVARIVRNVFAVEMGEKYENNNWNVGKASPTCLFYGGTFREIICSTKPGAIASFYRYTKRKGVERLIKDLKVAGGFAWNIRDNLFYFIDTCNLAILEYDYYPRTGKIGR